MSAYAQQHTLGLPACRSAFLRADPSLWFLCRLCTCKPVRSFSFLGAHRFEQDTSSCDQTNPTQTKKGSIEMSDLHLLPQWCLATLFGGVFPQTVHHHAKNRLPVARRTQTLGRRLAVSLHVLRTFTRRACPERRRLLTAIVPFPTHATAAWKRPDLARSWVAQRQVTVGKSIVMCTCILGADCCQRNRKPEVRGGLEQPVFLLQVEYSDRTGRLTSKSTANTLVW